MTSQYSDLVIASRENNNNHGSTLSFTTINPANANDYIKFVINQTNWGAALGSKLMFGWTNSSQPNTHIPVLNNDFTTMTIDGSARRLGINTQSPITPLHVSGATTLDGFTQINGSLNITGDITGTKGIIQARVFQYAGRLALGGNIKTLSDLTMGITLLNSQSVLLLRYVLNYEIGENNVFKVYRNNVLLGSQGTGLDGIASAAYDQDTNSTMANTVVEYRVPPPNSGFNTYSIKVEGKFDTFFLNRTAGTTTPSDLTGFFETGISTFSFYEFASA